MAQAASKDRALNELRKRLREKRYGDGRLPPERELAGILKVSRRALRHALGALEEEGIIWRRQGQGTFAGTQPMVGDGEVARLANRVNPLEIIEARLAIEPMLAGRAAMRASLADIEAMEQIATSALKARKATDYARADAAFHRKIAESGDNALLLAIFEMVIRVRDRVDWERVRQYYFRHDGARRSYEEHALVLRAIARRDPGGAEAAMRDHLHSISNTLLGMTASSPTGRGEQETKRADRR